MAMDSSVRRKFLFSSVCAICHENGFAFANRSAIETLTEMLQALIVEIGKTARQYCEHGGRTEPNVADIDIALVCLGIRSDSIPDYVRRSEQIILKPPTKADSQPTPRILQAGEKKPLPPYIPDYFPSFPDAHSYIRTPTYKQPVTEYEAIREKSASQKRDVERALTRFMAKTGDSANSHSLFPDEALSNLYPLIDLRLKSNVYLEALLPKDQIFEDEDEDTSDEKESPRKPPTNTNKPSTSTDPSRSGEIEAQNSPSVENEPPESEVLDNPYLREPKAYTAPSTSIN